MSARAEEIASNLDTVRRRLSDAAADAGRDAADVRLIVVTKTVPLPAIRDAGWRLAPIVVARQGRVALGDEIGERLGARLVVVLLGERPGLSSPDSLGAYLTFAPRIGLTDAMRNCVSNIHGAGLSYDEAAFKISWLVREGLARQVTGVALKDESGGGSPAGIASDQR